MRRVFFALLALSFLATPAVFAADVQAEAPVVVDQLSVDQLVVEETVEAVDVALLAEFLPATMLDLDAMTPGAAARCVYGQPSCYRDLQCDAFCGPGFGVCSRFCCLCSG